MTHTTKKRKTVDPSDHEEDTWHLFITYDDSNYEIKAWSINMSYDISRRILLTLNQLEDDKIGIFLVACWEEIAYGRSNVDEDDEEDEEGEVDEVYNEDWKEINKLKEQLLFIFNNNDNDKKYFLLTYPPPNSKVTCRQYNSDF